MTVPCIGRPPWPAVPASGPPPQVRLPLRDELYLLAHDEDGTARVHPAALGVGLAGAVLIDLLLTGRVRLWDGRIRNEYLDLPGDHIVESAVASLRREGLPPQVRPWLRTFAAAELYERVRANLVSVGILRRHGRRFRTDLYPPVHTVWTVRARGHIRSVLYGNDQPDVQVGALCGLIDVIGIPDTLSLSEPANEIRRHLRIVASGHLPPVREVTATVGQAIGDLATAAYG